MIIRMDVKIMSWNVRGSCDQVKLHSIKRLVLKHKPLIVGLQETKRGSVSVSTARAMWGERAHSWISLPSTGLSGGQVLIWDTDSVIVHEKSVGKHSITILCSLLGSTDRWACTSLYGPCDLKEKVGFWNEVADIEITRGVPWLILGDFNAIRVREERSSGAIIKRVARDFNNWVENLELCEFDRTGPFLPFQIKLLRQHLVGLIAFLQTWTGWSCFQV